MVSDVQRLQSEGRLVPCVVWGLNTIEDRQLQLHRLRLSNLPFSLSRENLATVLVSAAIERYQGSTRVTAGIIMMAVTWIIRSVIMTAPREKKTSS